MPLSLRCVSAVAIGAIVFLAPPGSLPSPQPQQQFFAVSATPAPQEPCDRFGDPLPPGALARIGTIRLRDHRDVERVALSPDGKVLVTTGDHSPLRVWNAVTGTPVRTIPTVEYQPASRDWPKDRLVPEEVIAMAFASDSRRLHVVTRNGVFRMCDVEDGTWSEVLARTRDPAADDDRFAGAWVSRDGTHFAYVTHTEPYRVEVFAVGKDQPVLELRDDAFGEMGRVCQFSPDNKRVAVTLRDGRVKVWDVATGQPVTVYNGPAGLRVLNFAISPDGRSVAAMYAPNDPNLWLTDPVMTLVGWDAATGKERFRVPNWQGYVAGYTSDGKKLLCTAGSEVLIADPTTGQLVRRLKGHGPTTFLGFALAADPNRFVTCGHQDSSVNIWDLTTGRPVPDIDAPRGGVTQLAFSPDGRTLFTGGPNDLVSWLWDARTGRPLHKLVAERTGRLPPSPLSAAFTPDGRHLVVGYGSGGTGSGADWIARLWNVADGKMIRDYPGHSDGVHRVLLSPDGKQLVTWDWGTNLRLWDLESGALSKTVQWGVYNHATALTYKRPGELIGVTSDHAGKSEAANLLSGKTLGSWGGTGRAGVAALSPDGQLVAVIEDSRPLGRDIVVIRRTATGEAVSVPPLRNVWGRLPIVFSPDGKLLAVSETRFGKNPDNAVHLYEVESGREVRTIHGHRGAISAIAFSPDGTRLATGGSDCTVLVWDLTAEP